MFCGEREHTIVISAAYDDLLFYFYTLKEQYHVIFSNTLKIENTLFG